MQWQKAVFGKLRVANTVSCIVVNLCLLCVINSRHIGWLVGELSEDEEEDRCHLNMMAGITQKENLLSVAQKKQKQKVLIGACYKEYPVK